MDASRYTLQKLKSLTYSSLVVKFDACHFMLDGHDPADVMEPRSLHPLLAPLFGLLTGYGANKVQALDLDAAGSPGSN